MRVPGLRHVQTALMRWIRYFVHNDYAGISAFVNVPADESQRNAQMLAVGALVPLIHGRLGKGWQHAEGLQELAKYDNGLRLTRGLDMLIHDPSEHLSNSDRLSMLEDYWKKNRVREGRDAEEVEEHSITHQSHSAGSPSLNGYRRPRAISGATALMTSHPTLPPHHPALSLPKFISDFGPLIFPLYRAALLRKRILMVGEPPVEPNCNFGTVHQCHF